jgi:hypothetical protein
LVLQTINEKRILKSLSFPDMYSRCEEVSEAAKDTFEWCLSRTSHPAFELGDLKYFETGLEKGTGAFHIFG